MVLRVRVLSLLCSFPLILIRSGSALKKQVDDSRSIRDKHVVKRTIKASYITQKISAMKNTLNNAINRFQVCIPPDHPGYWILTGFPIADNLDSNPTSYRTPIGAKYVFYVHALDLCNQPRSQPNLRDSSEPLLSIFMSLQSQNALKPRKSRYEHLSSIIWSKRRTDLSGCVALLGRGRLRYPSVLRLLLRARALWRRPFSGIRTSREQALILLNSFHLPLRINLRTSTKTSRCRSSNTFGDHPWPCRRISLWKNK